MNKKLRVSKENEHVLGKFFTRLNRVWAF